MASPFCFDTLLEQKERREEIGNNWQCVVRVREGGFLTVQMPIAGAGETEALLFEKRIGAEARLQVYMGQARG